MPVAVGSRSGAVCTLSAFFHNVRLAEQVGGWAVDDTEQMPLSRNRSGACFDCLAIDRTRVQLSGSPLSVKLSESHLSAAIKATLDRHMSASALARTVRVTLISDTI